MYESFGVYSVALPPKKSGGKETHTEIAQLIGDAQPAGANGQANGKANGQAKAPLGICCPGGEKVALPAKAAEALRGALEDLLDDDALVLDVLGPLVSPERAACLLGLSDAEFRRLAKSGEIDCDLEKDDTYVPFITVLSYAERRAAAQNVGREKIEADLWAMLMRQDEMQEKKLYPIRW